jgi:hypothetical protein
LSEGGREREGVKQKEENMAKLFASGPARPEIDQIKLHLFSLFHFNIAAPREAPFLGPYITGWARRVRTVCFPP